MNADHNPILRWRPGLLTALRFGRTLPYQYDKPESQLDHVLQTCGTLGSLNSNTLSFNYRIRYVAFFKSLLLLRAEGGLNVSK